MENILRVEKPRFNPIAMILLLAFTMLTGSLFSRGLSEDYQMLSHWQLPEDAIEKNELIMQDDILLLDGEPYSGWVYERYPEGTLSLASQYKNGKLNGMTFLWYPDGSPQMSASYKDGVLHGRFLGWYPNGTEIYNMFINRGAYAGDILAEEDQSRLREEQETYEQEGNIDDSTGE
nr:hypothetical protein [Candidatus Cloacimonadota bacterium]